MQFEVVAINRKHKLALLSNDELVAMEIDGNAAVAGPTKLGYWLAIDLLQFREKKVI